MTQSADLFARARRVTPGGVHSPVRSLQSVSEYPLFIDSAYGANIVDVDGISYTDYCMAFGPLIHGHSDPTVHRAAQAALDAGWSYGAAETTSLQLAELICSSIPWVESIRFVSSGTEAVMSALRVARAATGRDRVLKFSGCYHGHTDAMLISAGSGLAETASADSAGIPAGILQDTLVAPLNDIASLRHLFAEHGDTLAAAIIEPLPANYGLLPQTQEFLNELRTLCTAHSSLLIFDEVITGFRFGFQGYAGTCGITPDLVTYGKIIGGGFPVGAFGGRRDLMNQVAPAGPVYQAGTMSANPLAMKAGLAALELLLNLPIYQELNALGEQLAAELKDHPHVYLQREGSLFWLCATDTAALAGQSKPLRSIGELPGTAGYAKLFQHCLKDGIYLPPSPFEVGFLSAAHKPEHITALTQSLQHFTL
jgi:glutamate-1-semialdehyde 2,1-aminomutase